MQGGTGGPTSQLPCGASMARHEDVTVVIPCFNHGRFLLGSVERALGQQGGPPKVIVVDDGSTDQATERALAELPDGVRLIRQQNAGVSAARNAGFESLRFGAAADGRRRRPPHPRRARCAAPAARGEPGRRLLLPDEADRRLVRRAALPRLRPLHPAPPLDRGRAARARPSPLLGGRRRLRPGNRRLRGLGLLPERSRRAGAAFRSIGSPTSTESTSARERRSTAAATATSTARSAQSTPISSRAARSSRPRASSGRCTASSTERSGPGDRSRPASRRRSTGTCSSGDGRSPAQPPAGACVAEEQVLVRVQLAALDRLVVEEFGRRPVLDVEAGCPEAVGEVVAVDPDVILLAEGDHPVERLGDRRVLVGGPVRAVGREDEGGARGRSTRRSSEMAARSSGTCSSTWLQSIRSKDRPVDPCA